MAKVLQDRNSELVTEISKIQDEYGRVVTENNRLVQENNQIWQDNEKLVHEIGELRDQINKLYEDIQNRDRTDDLDTSGTEISLFYYFKLLTFDLENGHDYAGRISPKTAAELELSLKEKNWQVGL